MDAIDQIKQHLGPEAFAHAQSFSSTREVIQEREKITFFSQFKIYAVYGQYSQFDFGIPRGGSCALYAANETEAIRLSRAGKEIEAVLQREWHALPNSDPEAFARFLLGFYDDGKINGGHGVWKSVQALWDWTREVNCGVVPLEFARAKLETSETHWEVHEQRLVLHVITVSDWSDTTSNLGIERISIHQSGKVEFEPRRVLSEKIFQRGRLIRF